MGMFDYLRCHYPLPVQGANALEYQTKDTGAQYMDQYEIRADGTLWHEEYDIEDHSDPNAEPGTFASLRGMCARVRQRWVREEALTGEICFSHWDSNTNAATTFSAYFVRGDLKHLETLESRRNER